MPILLFCNSNRAFDENEQPIVSSSPAKLPRRLSTHLQTGKDAHSTGAVQRAAKRRVPKASIGTPCDFVHFQHVDSPANNHMEAWDLDRWQDEIQRKLQAKTAGPAPRSSRASLVPLSSSPESASPITTESPVDLAPLKEQELTESFPPTTTSRRMSRPPSFSAPSRRKPVPSFTTSSAPPEVKQSSMASIRV